MAWRKWVVRGLVFGVAAALGAGAILYQYWTDPAEVRRQLIAHLSAKFPGATVTVESARLRLFGGIAVSELRMTRRDDADMVNFLHIPSGTIYHEKDQVLSGKFAIRKIVLEQPRLHVVRDRDGRWNLAGLLAPSDRKERLPTLIVKQGVVVVEDRQAPGAEPVEIKDVSLKVVNDPEMTVTFEGSGASDATGPVQITGTWQRDTGQTTLVFDAPAVPVGPPLVRRLAAVCAEAAEQAHGLSGTGNLRARLDYRPDTAQPWGHDVTFALTEGKFSHKLLPFSLEGVEASLHCVNGRIARAEATAHAGPASVRAAIEDVRLPFGCAGPAGCPLENLFKKAEISVDHLPVTPELLDRLPEKYRAIKPQFAPSGPVNVRYEIWKDGAKGLRKRMTLKPEGMSGRFEKFPYPVGRLTGDIVSRGGGGEPDRLDVDLAGYAGGQPIRIKAKAVGTKPDYSLAIDVRGDNIPLDPTLMGALASSQSPKPYALARSFDPTGLANFQVHADWHPDPSLPEGGRFDNTYVIEFHDATVVYNLFPYRLEKVKGVLDIRPDRWEFRQFEGHHGGGTFYTAGRSRRDAGGTDHVEIAIAGRGVRLDDDLKGALKDDLQPVWASFRPEGTIDFDGTVRLDPAGAKEPAPDIELTVLPRGCRVTPKVFAYALGDLRGKVHYEKGTVELENITAVHGKTRVRLDRGVVQLKPGGGFKADLTDLHGDPLLTDGEFLAALPPALRQAVGALAVEGALGVRTRLYIDAPPPPDPPRIYWDGMATMRDVSLRTGVKLEHVTGTVAVRGWHDGRHIDGAEGNLDIKQLTLFNQPIRDLTGALLVTDDEPDVLKMPGLMATYFGGQVYGPVRLEFGPKLRYKVNLTASRVKIEEFGRHNFNNRDLSGLAVARVYLEGEGGELSGLKGNGRIDVPEGRMYNLPLLLDLLKFLGLRLPDRTAFEEAHVVFDIEGVRAHVRKLELYGNAISLRGYGDTNVDGSDLAFSFNVDWGRLGQVLPAGVREVPREISNQLFRIDMRGKAGDLHFREAPVPLIWDPIRKAFSGGDNGT